MEPRTIAIGLIAVIAAFAAAFGISSSGGGKTATAGPGTKAQEIKVAAPAAVTGVEVGGALPSLKSEPRKPKKKAAKKTPESSAPSTQNTAPPTQNTAPPTQNTAPPTQNTAPPTQNTAPPTQNNGGGGNGGGGGGEEPVSGGGEVG
jgi:hypothetical protein